MYELFVMAVWAAPLLLKRGARIALSVRLAPVMRKVRQGIIPALFVVAGFAPLTHAHSQPRPTYAGAALEDTQVAAIMRDGISLDEAVSRAERQYHARVVRSDVQDEDGRKVYVLKLLSDDGRVFTVRIDANSGRNR